MTPCNISPSIPLMPSTAFRPIGSSSCTPAGLVSDECDASWKRQIQGLVSEASVTPEQVLTALQMFNVLFKVSKSIFLLIISIDSWAMEGKCKCKCRTCRD